MPSLDDKIHIQMLNAVPAKDGALYGMHWGDPDSHSQLRVVVERYIKPYVDPAKTCVEIGPGGGRWTRYLLGFKQIYAVDYFQELLDEFNKNFSTYSNITTVKNNGTDFPNIPDNSVDFLFSFGVFVHLDLEIIDSYLSNMRRLFHKDSLAFIQYSDKNKKEAQENKGFSMNTPEQMRALLGKHKYEIIDEDVELLSHSSMVLFRLI